MNHPKSPNPLPIVTIASGPPHLYTLVLLTAALIISLNGCSRGSSNDVQDQASPTPAGSLTSVAVLASTPTFTPESEDSTSGREHSATDDSENASDSDQSNEQGANEDSAETKEPSTNTQAEQASLGCETEIALDLVGHPEYAKLPGELGCPLSQAVLDPVAINEFGTGPEYDRFMLWFSSTTEIYILKPDKTWQAFVDTWSDDEDEIQCNPFDGAMTSPPLPRRGFGKLWCADDNIQTAMGTIEREERLCQHTVLQQFEKGALLGCFEDATIRYIQLFDDSSWEMQFVQ